MKEIWKMWRMIRLLKNNRSAWANEKTSNELMALAVKARREEEGKQNLEAEDVLKKEVVHLMPLIISDLNRDPQVFRKTLLLAYLSKYYNNRNKKCSRDDFLTEAQSIIQSCIDDKKQFIQSTEKNPNVIFLTRNGKAFAGIDGLLKEAITNGLGVLWSIIITGIGVAGAIKWSAIWSLIVKLFKVVF